ncbi:two-component system, LuxR family, sensor kinase FixL [Methylophilaceae bacterium]|nr:two-component system, LuxR family, sensor kinase FixL [Methylophilaceae bacterium]
MLLVDDEGRVIQANPAVQQMLGYMDDANMIGAHVEALMPARYRESHRHNRKAFSGNPEKRSMGNGKNLVVLTRDGKELLVDIGLSPIQDKGQHYVLITFHVADRRHQAERALWDSEKRLQLAKNAAGLGVFDYDLLNQEVLCDERIRELWGLSRQEAVFHEKLMARLHPEDLPVRNNAFKRALDPGGDGEYQVEYRVINEIDSSEHWVSITGKVFFSEGLAVRMAGIVQDITDRKRLERELRVQRAEMDHLAKHQVATQTAAAIAHELNQPLAAISAYSEVALRSMSSNLADPDKLVRALEGCFTQAQRAGKSLHELLSFLQKEEVEVESIDLNDLVQEVLNNAKNDGYSDFHLILELEKHLPPVTGSRTQVRKVLINLLYNGVEAMREAGIPAASITIQVRTMKSRKFAQVSIRDSGPGIDPAMMSRIFEPFFSTRKKGMGMGLTISRALIEAMGGQLWIDPEKKPGTAFHFSLPLAA